MVVSLNWSKNVTICSSRRFQHLFDYSVVKTEQMTTEQLFTILDDFDTYAWQPSTKPSKLMRGRKAKRCTRSSCSPTLLLVMLWMTGLDPYVPFSKSLRRWIESFGRLNIEYSQTTLKLDLLDRKGKYPNGFCLGLSFFYMTKMLGLRLKLILTLRPWSNRQWLWWINTLFHEGGHAAHFST